MNVDRSGPVSIPFLITTLTSKLSMKIVPRHSPLPLREETMGKWKEE